MLLIFGACSSESTEEPDPVLDIYIYSPGKGTVTRSVSTPTAEEKRVHSLTLWVYKSNSDTQLGSLTLSAEQLESLNEKESGVYSIPVTSLFARNPEPVDVYVLANVSANNTGTMLDPTIADKTSLENALFNGGYYYGFVRGDGGYRAMTEISGEGLPMSGVVRGRTVTNVNAVLHVTDANLGLVRDVSKIRLVFSSLTGADKLYIDEVKLDGGMMYNSTYLFVNDEHPYFRVGENGTFDREVVLATALKDEEGYPQYVNSNGNPRQYAYESGMDESMYEAKIAEGLEKKELTEAPVVYLPESDKRLTGTITYHFAGNPSEQHETRFMMLGGDFRRNQTWIVYVYYTGASRLDVSTVNVTKWQYGGQWDHEVHNW